MTSEELNEAINSQLFVPISGELVEHLFEVTESLALTLGEKEVDSYSRSFFSGEIDCIFTKQVSEQYEDLFGVELIIPTVVFRVLQICIVLIIIESGDLDKDVKAKYSLIVRNNAVLAKANFGKILCTHWIEKMYSFYISYGDKSFKKCLQFEPLMKTIVSRLSWSETGLDLNDLDVYNQLRSLCVYVVRSQIITFSKSQEFMNLNSPFAKIYVLVSRMVRTWHWVYIEHSPVKLIIETMGSDIKKRKKLKRIVEEVRRELPDGDIVFPRQHSSILLDRVAFRRNIRLDETMFTSLEFGIYLYYEMLLENYNI